VIYLTHRPEVLTARTKQWLRENDFPPGAVLTAAKHQTVEDNGKFKSARLAALRKEFPGVAIGVGDLVTDAQAYLDNGMTAYLIPQLGSSPTDDLALAGKVRSLPAQDRLQVVSDWAQIGQGVLDGSRFTAEAFARKLEALAGRK